MSSGEHEARQALVGARIENFVAIYSPDGDQFQFHLEDGRIITIMARDEKQRLAISMIEAGQVAT